jgi:tetratricopeptide (TPR) repeat protein
LYAALGNQFAANGDLQTGVNYFAQALTYSQDDSETAAVNVAWGDALRQAAKLDAAAERFRAALARDSSNVTAWVGLGRVYLAQNQLPAAGDALQHALALDDTSYPALFFLANYYDQTGQAALAQEYYTRAGQIIPELTMPP